MKNLVKTLPVATALIALPSLALAQDAALGFGGRAVNLCQIRGLPPILINGVRDMAVEVAIGAFRSTEGPMHVNAEPGFAPGFNQSKPE